MEQKIEKWIPVKYDPNSEKQQCFTITIDKELALHMLDSRPDNRAIRYKSRVKQLVRDLQNGTMRTNGESICVNTNFKVVDGQHRLTAVIESGIPHEFVVVVVPKGQEQGYDSGMSRSYSDHMLMCDDERVKAVRGTDVAAIARFFAIKKAGGKTGLTASDVIAVIKDNIEEFEWFVTMKNRKNKKGLARAGTNAAIIAAYKNGYSENGLKAFREVLASGLMSEQREAPFIKYREWLLSPASLVDNRNTIPGTETYMRAQYALYCYEQHNTKARSKEAAIEYYPMYSEE